MRHWSSVTTNYPITELVLLAFATFATDRLCAGSVHGIGRSDWPEAKQNAGMDCSCPRPAAAGHESRLTTL